MIRPSASLWAAPLALIFLGLLAFFNAIRHPFVHDDVIFILNNPHIAELNHWPQAFKVPAPPMAGPAASGDINTYYRPFLEIIYRFEYHLFGPHPFGFHFFNVMVHIINGLLLFGLLQKLGLRKAVAWVIACIFLIHPVQTEAVSCISGISNLWMTFGILLALHAYLNRWYTVTLLCFTAAFLSKEQAMMFVPLVVVIDYSQGNKNLGSWFFWAAFACILWWLRQSVTGASVFKDIISYPGELHLRLMAIPRDLGMYVRFVFCPYDLHYYRSTDILQSNRIAWILALISILGIFYALHRWSKARGTLILGFGWFLAALLPVLNIAPLINEYSFILTAEHFLYLPIVGLLIVAVVAGDHFLKHFRKLLLGIVVVSCLLLTWHQNTFWSSEIALFERMLRFEPDFGRGHFLLAKVYYFNGRPQDAQQHFKKAFTIMSAYAKKAVSPIAKNFYLGYLKQILFYWGRNESAMGHLDPAFAQARNNLIQLGGP